jgi:predicted PhzF superfamily epimerase YddE/YHI9
VQAHDLATAKYELQVLRVFCDAAGRFGNPLGVFATEPIPPAIVRQALAHRLAFSETVFVDDPSTGELEIFTPNAQLPFAGHPLVGTAWFLLQRDPSLSVLRPPAGDVHITGDGQLTWITAKPEYSPPWQLRELAGPATVDALLAPPENLGCVGAWAWLDRDQGLVRARVFAHDLGIDEDPATGSAAISLCAALGHELRIMQGPAHAQSEILVRPLADGWVRLGGRVLPHGAAHAVAAGR